MTVDLQVEIGTQEQKLWTDLRKRAEDTIRQSKAEIMINERIIVLADEQIRREKEKLK